jgi:tRNA A-37 threonylcarbamoyl transferase component Bud32/tetratricopeptide (TPR) repeat protein
VLLALDSELQRDVALKEIQPAFADQPEHQQRFVREAEITGRLEHPGVVPVYGLGRYPDSRPYYAMRFIKGQSLRQALKEFHDPNTGPTDPGQRQLRLRQLLNHFVVVCNTIAYAHSKGVLHRDIKPDNVMLGPYGETLVVDWGLAKIMGQAEEAPPAEISTLKPPEGEDLTPAGWLVGTPAFMSPEQAAGEVQMLGPACDVYSLGATLYTLLTGQPPFRGLGIAAILESVRGGHFPPPRQVNPRVPAALDAVVRKAMALRPADRYGSARELGEDVERWLADEPVRAQREAPWQTFRRLLRRHREVVRVTAGALVMMTLVTVLLVNNARWKQREHQIQMLERDLQDAWKEGSWDQAHLEFLQGLADRLETLDREVSRRAREQTEERLAEVIRQALQTRVLDPARVERIRAQIALLGPLSATADRKAQELRAGLNQRVPEWQPLFALTAPFQDRANLFADDHVTVEPRSRAVLLPDRPPNSPVVPTRFDSKGSVRLTAEFTSSWTSAPAVGLLLNLTEGSSYRFLVTVPEFKPESEGALAEQQSLGATLQAGVPVRVLLLRNSVVLRQQDTYLPIDRPLRLIASREGERLSLQVNTLEPLVSEDIFPLQSEPAGVFGLWWPKGVELVRLEGSDQLQAPPTSGLEPGDELFTRNEYAASLAWYRQKEQGAAGEPLGQHVRFKQGLALYALGRKDEARALWDQLFREMPADADAATARWSLRAAAQLWLDLLHQNKVREAEAFLNLLLAGFGFEQLAPLLPAEVRRDILARTIEVGYRSRTPFHTEANLEKLLQAWRVEEILSESAYERRVTRWLLVDAYRILGQHVWARIVLDRLLGEKDLSLTERVALVRESVWMHIEGQRPREGLKAIERLRGHSPDRQVLPLLLERARVHVALENWDQADRDMTEFFRQAGDRPATRLDYADWADGCLLQGLLLERQGQQEEAQKAWKKGLLRNWPGGRLPDLPYNRELSGVAANNRANAVTFLVLLSSLTGELTEPESELIFNPIPRRLSGAQLAERQMRQALFPPSFIRKATETAFQSPRGRDLIRRMAYRQIPLQQFLKDPLVLRLAECLHQGAWPGQVPEELDRLFNETAWALIRRYPGDFFFDDEFRDLLGLWSVKVDPGPTWKEVAPRLGPDLRLSVAVILGGRMQTAGKPEWARPFFQEVVDAKPSTFLLRLAREQLRNLPRE